MNSEKRRKNSEESKKLVAVTTSSQRTKKGNYESNDEKAIGEKGGGESPNSEPMDASSVYARTISAL